MVITYEVSTQYVGNARDIAMRRAKAEGWGSATVTGITQVSPEVYEVTVTVFK